MGTPRANMRRWRAPPASTIAALRRYQPPGPPHLDALPRAASSKRLVTDRETRRIAFGRFTRNRAFMLSLPRLILAYRTGAMRYGLFVFTRGRPGGSAADA